MDNKPVYGKLRLYSCPNKDCRYAVSETHYLYNKFDHTCPRCHQHKLSEFKHKGRAYGDTQKAGG